MPYHFNFMHEANIQAYTYMALTFLGYKCELEYNYTDDNNIKYRFDLVILDDFNNIIFIIEFKRESIKPSGIVDCYSLQSDPQLRKYCNLYFPIYLCVGMESVKGVIKYILNTYD